VPQLTTASRITRTSVRSWCESRVKPQLRLGDPIFLDCVFLSMSACFISLQFFWLFFFKMAENMSVFLF
jgi:hypothetical protein